MAVAFFALPSGWAASPASGLCLACAVRLFLRTSTLCSAITRSLPIPSVGLVPPQHNSSAYSTISRANCPLSFAFLANLPLALLVENTFQLGAPRRGRWCVMPSVTLWVQCSVSLGTGHSTGPFPFRVRPGGALEGAEASHMFPLKSEETFRRQCINKAVTTSYSNIPSLVVLEGLSKL